MAILTAILTCPGLGTTLRFHVHPRRQRPQRRPPRPPPPIRTPESRGGSALAASMMALIPVINAST